VYVTDATELTVRRYGADVREESREACAEIILGSLHARQTVLESCRDPKFESCGESRFRLGWSVARLMALEPSGSEPLYTNRGFDEFSSFMALTEAGIITLIALSSACSCFVSCGGPESCSGDPRLCHLRYPGSARDST
jgi:hypothetical protein